VSRAAGGERRPRVLRLVLTAGETSAPYNQFSLGWRERHAITLCTLFSPEVATPPELRVFDGGGSVAGFLRALRRALAAGDYDLVHAHSPHVAFLFLVTRLLFRARSLPTVFTLHTSYPNLKLRNLLLLLPVLLRFDRVVCCSRASLESFPGWLRRLGGERLVAIQNGVDIARVDRALAGRSRPAPGPGLRAVAVGRLMELKQPLLLIRAFAQLADPESRLRFVGAGPLEGAIRQAAREACLGERVELSGLIPREAVYAGLAAADVYVSASRCEGLPVAALEAMACGRPVVLSDIPPHREIAAGVDFVPLVAPDDAAGFARELARLRDLGPARRREIGARCRRLVEERFGLEAMVRGYESVYAEVCSGRPPLTTRRAGDVAR
jgi:glycosyltransferase involved in cell wall biosynthesis